MTRTPSQTVGPFFAIGLCRAEQNRLVPEGIELRGRLLDGEDEAIPDGVVEVWDGTHWGRSATDGEGRFSFVVPADVSGLWAYVFARGLLRHQLTRIHVGDAPDPTLLAAREDGGLRFDIRMQGDRATLFFEH